MSFHLEYLGLNVYTALTQVIDLHLMYIDVIQQMIFNCKGNIGLLMLLFKNYTKIILRTK